MDNYEFELQNPYNPSIRKELKKEVIQPLSDGQIAEYFGNKRNFDDHVLTVSELNPKTSKFKDLDDLFSSTPLNSFYGYKIILQEHTRPGNGHWIVILKYKYKNKVVYEYFDSYGEPIGKILELNGASHNRDLGQERDFLKDLFHKKMAGSQTAKCIYNDEKFQDSNPKIATCGRWCILRILLCEHFKMNLQDFYNFIHRLKTITYKKLSRDEICCLLVDINYKN